MVTSTAFEAAIKLTEAIYTHAVIHCVAEKVDSVWHNLYTSAIYGREIDLRSVPTDVEHAEYDQHLVCLRVRVAREEAARLLAAARTGSALFRTWEIRYATEETIEGFRPASRFMDLSDQSFWEKSLWCREGIGSRKTFGGDQLRDSNAWRVSEYLTCLQEARWSPIPLAWHPEKIGDLDEIYPSPISVGVGIEDGASAIRVSSLDPSLLRHEIVTMGTLIQDDLIVRAFHLVGEGPLRFEEEFNGMSVLTTVDGVPMDAQANWFLDGSISVKMTMYGKRRFRIPADRRRKELDLAVPYRQPKSNLIGARRPSLVRHQAWVAGRLFRSQIQPNDAEHFYNPTVDPDAPTRALYDLQHYGKEQCSPEVVVADPYALDERVMHALAVMALREDHVPHIHVLTQFNSSATERTAPYSTTGEPQQKASAMTQRAATMQRAKAAAQKVATELKVTMSFYTIEGLHDRFLLVGDRLWHIGCSFNQLGLEITAIVEMRDTKVKHAVMETFNAVRKQPPVFEIQP